MEGDATRVGPSPALALGLSAAVLVIYTWFVASGAAEALYDWSKTLAPYSVRQYLGMSKRFLLQWGHMVFLFALLVLSRYVWLSGRSLPTAGRLTDFVVRYSTAIFLFHFPIMFFLAAVTQYDRTRLSDQLALLAATFLLSILLGRLCLALKPAFDRWQKRAVAAAEARFPRPEGIGSGAAPLVLTRSHSEFLNQVKAIAMICVVLGHYSFDDLTTLHIPGFNGAAPRFAVPVFFMISGYFLMLSIDRSRLGAAALIVRRGFSLYYIIVPMLLITLALDAIGVRANPQLYNFPDYYLVEMGRPYKPWEILAAIGSSLLYLNESWWFAQLAIHSDHGGMRAFSNDPFWFMCYLIPFSILLVVLRLGRPGWRAALLALWFLAFGSAILLLAPLFLAGSLAYLIHQHWRLPDAAHD